MLELKKVSKIYYTDEIELKALDSVSVNLRRNEFVSILGPSGSGKTTMLNILGGLDHYTSGDLIIDGVSTKDFIGRDWDAYRNHRVGFVFQNYNLISHQTVLSNVELALTLSGVSSSGRKKRAAEALKKVGLEKHMRKLPNQLSGGQMQRVAIARALVNNPDIILADEPTGALDSKTSVQIMELLKEIAKDKLVVMVTHNPELAKEYSTRIITVKDGKVMDDTNPFDGEEAEEKENGDKYTSMSLLTALKLSKNNLVTKRGRTIITAIAGSIGIIGIALILAIANGVNKYANNLITEASLPSAISVQRVYIDSSSVAFSAKGNRDTSATGDVVFTNDLKDNSNAVKQQQIRHNDTVALKEYIDNHKKELSEYTEVVKYDYGIEVSVYDKDANGKIVRVNPIDEPKSKTPSGLSDVNLEGVSTVEVSEEDFIKTSMTELISDKNVEMLSGKYPTGADELLLVLNNDGKMSVSTAYALNILDRTELDKFVDKVNKGEELTFNNEASSFDDIIDKTYKLTVGDQTYDNGQTLKIVGVAKAKSKSDTGNFLGYTHDLVEKVIAKSGSEYDINDPLMISIYPKTEDDKKKVKTFLDNYNNQAEEAKKVHYADQTQIMIDSIKTVINMISYVLIAFVAISLVVSSIMIGIITYISVLERTKEIGILRAIGATKRDVRRVFRAETIIEGFVAGLFGVAISWLLCMVINVIVEAFNPEIKNIADFSILQAVILIVISMGLTVVAGLIPAGRAAKKDPVEALRSE
ncbi:ATP-binding cassette domain-containing protein [Candidatus Saccharibacteria bacterium]|nr:ATP-binding cassette domain-containing protein [Candidatus Saccharibacteria bacterium]